MKRDFQINLTALANDDETKRMTEALMTSAAGNAANHDADRYVAVGGQQDDGKVENDRFVAEGPGDDKVETGDRDRFVAVGLEDDGKVETGRYIAVSVGDDKIEDALREGTPNSPRLGGDSYVAVGADGKIFD